MVNENQSAPLKKPLDAQAARGLFHHMWNSWMPVATWVAQFLNEPIDGFSRGDPKLIKQNRGYQLYSLVGPEQPGVRIEQYYSALSSLIEASDREKAERLKGLVAEGNRLLTELKEKSARCEYRTHRQKIDKQERQRHSHMIGKKDPNEEEYREYYTFDIPDEDLPEIEKTIIALKQVCLAAGELLYGRPIRFFDIKE